MLALVLGDRPALARDLPPPERPPGEARVAMRLAGVCDTDLQLARGYMGFRGVPGHEFVGEVLEADDRVLVLGDGKLGLLIAMALARAGLDTTLVGRHPGKLALAPGVATRLESELPESLTAPVVVEATGSESGLARALSLCAPRGTLILKSTLAGAHGVDLSPVVVNEVAVVGSRCGDMAAAVACLARGSVDPRPLIAARYPLREAARALAHAGQRGALKVLIEG